MGLISQICSGPGLGNVDRWQTGDLKLALRTKFLYSREDELRCYGGAVLRGA